VARRKVASGNSKLKLEVEIDDDVLELKLSRFAQKLDDFRRFWTDFFAPQFFDDVQKNFAAQGRFVGGWRALKPEYAAWKLRHYGPKPILVRTGAMRESLRTGGRGNILRAFKAYGIFGSTVRYLVFHQRGTRQMPQRRVLWIGPHATYKRLLAEFVRDEMRAAGFRDARMRA
jgi:phage gpG-like protein